MQEERIRLSSTDSVNSVNRNNFVDVNLKQHTKLFPFPDITDTIDQYEVFEKERSESTKYRLIVTINPYCSNILFNACTEIVKNEGSNDVILVDEDGVDIKYDKEKDKIIISNRDKTIISDGDYTIVGKNEGVTNVDMIRNTEYASGSEPFIYHCGYDIFNNHILRNQSFKVVNPIGGQIDGKPNYKDVYNTIEDYMRTANGAYIPLKVRKSLTDVADIKERHLYLHDDIMSVTDCINTVLSEQNGWFGFMNRSSIQGQKYVDAVKKWNDLKISKVFNGDDDMGCSFIEMYPDSSLYSFNPKYNPYKNREEHNWDVCLTYPYSNDYGYKSDKKIINGKEGIEISITRPIIACLVKKGTITSVRSSLLMASVVDTKGTSGQNILLFRSYIKHNLRAGDSFKVLYKNDGENTFVELENVIFTVTNTGNLDDNYHDYYFYINNPSRLTEKFVDWATKKPFIRIIKVINGVDCRYYFRKFRKLPNLRYKREELTDDIAIDKTKFDSFVNDLRDNKYNFSKEQYPLAFSKTIYGDNKTQVTFTDTIDIDKITDNLGRKLTTIYLTIIKRNKGHEVWYTSPSDESVEYSHCFGPVSCGIEMHGEKGDTQLLNRKKLNDVTCVKNDNYFIETDITLEDKDEFYGDIVELDQFNLVETTLSDVCFRFNTLQRETDETDLPLKFEYDDLWQDDYDLEDFHVEHYESNKINNGSTTYRPEGYYYKAHYPIAVRTFGRMQQGSDMKIKVKECRPRQAGGMFIEVTSLTRVELAANDKVYIVKDGNRSNKIYLTVNQVLSSTHFILNPMVKDDNNTYYSVYDLVEKINSDNYHLRVKNVEIPSYAYEVSDNVFLWRDILNVGDINATDLQEYAFANGHFYVNKEIDFFLKRQDPFAWNGLQDTTLWPNDIFGFSKKESVYEYKDPEQSAIC